MKVNSWTSSQTETTSYNVPTRKKNFFPRIWILRRMTFEFEYLGEFTFKFENFLDPETGSQTGWIDEKNWGRKSRASVPLRQANFRNSLRVNRWENQFQEDKEEKGNRKCSWFSFVSQNIYNKIMLQSLGEIWCLYRYEVNFANFILKYNHLWLIYDLMAFYREKL